MLGVSSDLSLALLVTKLHFFNSVLVPPASTNLESIMNFDRPNDPNAGRLVESLRYLGYGNYEAIADLVDNSIDAEGQRIAIHIQQKSGQAQISIADNGTGMTQDVLDQ